MLDRILCIDDDPITVMLCRKVIQKSEFAKIMDSAQNGEDALHYFDKLIMENDDHFPELILLDLNMPVMGGWEFLDNFSRDTYANFFSNTKVIVLSSTIDPQDVEKSKTYPMVIDFMSKPITKEMLEKLKLVFGK
ncbi:MAG TPA: response regulator [Flavobacterium sp.]|nr:response regulator [Flavobacterium sp.]